MDEKQRVAVRVLEHRVRQSAYLRLRNASGEFVIGVRTPASVEQWYLLTPGQNYHGDSMEAVFAQAEQDWPELRSWANAFK